MCFIVCNRYSSALSSQTGSATVQRNTSRCTTKPGRDFKHGSMLRLHESTGGADCLHLHWMALIGVRCLGVASSGSFSLRVAATMCSYRCYRDPLWTWVNFKFNGPEVLSHKLGSSLCLGVNPTETVSEVLVSYFVRARLLAVASSQWEGFKCKANLVTESVSFCLLMVRYSRMSNFLQFLARMSASSPSLPVPVCSEYVCCKFVWVLVQFSG
jgi:hypothetical protein